MTTSYPLKTLPNGAPNPKYIDVLSEDRELAGQKYVLMSFVSPEEEIKQKEHYFFEAFAKQWFFATERRLHEQFAHFLAFKYNLDRNQIVKDLESFLKAEEATMHATADQLFNTDYKSFIELNEEELTQRFQREHNFQTSVRGVKVRGSFATMEEANLRLDFLKDHDPDVDIHVGMVGIWMPMDPHYNGRTRERKIQYPEEQLNQLMHQRLENQEEAKKLFDQRVLDAKKQSIQENRANAEKYGIKLTQTIDEEGNLINLQKVSKETIASLPKEALYKTLFEGDDIVQGPTDHGQSQLLSGPFKLTSSTSASSSSANA